MKTIFYELSQFFEYQDEIDLYTILALIFINLFLWRINKKNWLWYIFTLIFLGYLLPNWSCHREVQREVAKYGGGLDGFNLLYALFVYPKYWVLTFLQILCLFFKPKRVKSDIVDNGILDQKF